MRRRDLLKAGAGVTATGALACGDGALRLLHVVDGDEDAVQSVVDFSVTDVDGVLDRDVASGIITNFPIEVRHVPEEHFESGLLLFHGDMDEDETHHLLEEILDSGVVFEDHVPIVTNFPVHVTHVDESLLGDGILVVSARMCSDEDVELLRRHLVDRGVAEDRLVVAETWARVEVRHFDDEKQAVSDLARDLGASRLRLKGLVERVLRWDTSYDDASFRAAVVAEMRLQDKDLDAAPAWRRRPGGGVS